MLDLQIVDNYAFGRLLAFNRESEKTYSLSMIGDAMSKWKTTVPHLAREPKSLDSQGNRLQYSLTASKIHGLCSVADWQYGGQFQGPGSGCNFSCSVILANLHLVEEMTGEIPRHFKLQMDNCAKDDKNSTVLGFCGLLVAEGIVETVEVSHLCYANTHGLPSPSFCEQAVDNKRHFPNFPQINFLMVGHTHEDIDGLFGILANKLQNQNAFTPNDMNALFAQAGKSASNDMGGRASVGIVHSFLPNDGHESRLWRCIADWRLWMQVTC